MIADLIEEGTNFEIKSDLDINPALKVVIGLQQLDYCYIAESIKINDEERFLLKRFVKNYKLIKRDDVGVLIVIGRKGNVTRHLPNVFFELFNFLDENEEYDIQDILDGKLCKIHR